MLKSGGEVISHFDTPSTLSGASSVHPASMGNDYMINICFVSPAQCSWGISRPLGDTDGSLPLP